MVAYWRRILRKRRRAILGNFVLHFVRLDIRIKKGKVKVEHDVQKGGCSIP
jgi:hypothetical protein